MTDLILIAVLALICGSAAVYVYRVKKRGAKCIGCPAGESCSSCGCGCGCGCNSTPTCC